MTETGDGTRRQAQKPIITRLRFNVDSRGRPYGRYLGRNVVPCNKGHSCPHCQGILDVSHYVGKKGPERTSVLIFPDDIVKLPGREPFYIAHKMAPNEVAKTKRELSRIEKIRTAFGANIDTKQTPVSVVACGGMPFRGGSCTAYWNHETDTILVVDYGRKIRALDPTDNEKKSRSEIGIDELPYEDFLVRNKERIQAIIITHQHLDHCGALPYLPKELADIPVYMTPFCKETVVSICETSQLPEPEIIRLFNPGQAVGFYSGGMKWEIEGFVIKSFPLLHSTPETVGFDIRAGNRRILHFGDFNTTGTSKMDQEMQNRMFDDLIHEGKIDLVTFDAVGVSRQGKREFEDQVDKSLEEIIANAPERVIIATFASNVERIGRLIEISHKLGRKVAPYGQAMQMFWNNAVSLGYLNAQETSAVSVLDMLSDKKEVAFVTGGQAEQGAQLTKLAYRQEGGLLTLLPTDTIVIAQDPIPGNEKRISQLVETLKDNGYTVHTNRQNGYLTHVSGHCLKDDLDVFLRRFARTTKAFMPQHMNRSSWETIKELYPRYRMIVPRFRENTHLP